jgi:NRPS condensation-like uncharacterized protein
MYSSKWYRLDNAAKVFPAIASKRATNTFRLAMTLKEEIDKDLLQQALELTIKRFPTLNVRLRKGMFWFYFDENNNTPFVREESPYICSYMNPKNNNGFLFTVSCFERRISIEFFHSLTDGSGGMEFLKAVVYQYLLLKGNKITNTGEVLSDEMEILTEEAQDSFNYNYDPNVKINRKEIKSFRINGTEYLEHWTGNIEANIAVESIKKVAKENKATITEYITACFLYAIYITSIRYKKNDRPVKVFVPVNLRKFFPSRTLRNFSLYIRTEMSFDRDDITFEEILQETTSTFKDELVKEKLHGRLVSNVKFERNFLLRITPLFIKKFAIRIGYYLLGASANTGSFSNLGIVEVPSDMAPLIDKVIFTIGASHNNPINMSAITFNGNLVLVISSSIRERNIQREMFQQMIKDGVDIIIETNELEV